MRDSLLDAGFQLGYEVGYSPNNYGGLITFQTHINIFTDDVCTFDNVIA